ncbi:MAG: histone deacetylase family protein [Alphaproteobacteria bacterium]
MKIVYSPDHKLRDTKTELCGGELLPPFECAERLDYIIQELGKRNFGSLVPPQQYGLEPVLTVHDKDYIAFLETAWQDWKAEGNKGEAIASSWPARTICPPGFEKRIPKHIEARLGHYCLASETSIAEGSWNAAVLSKDVALTALDLVWEQKEQVAFGLCRPPGHHASTSQFGGYCFINNAAVCAQMALDKGAGKVAILDVDFHHGNGTQEIFYARDDVLFASLHGDPDETFPYFSGFADETGIQAGDGYNLNYPLPAGTDFKSWRKAFMDAAAKIIAFAPELLIVSLGVDTFERDPISSFKFTNGDFVTMGKDLANMGLPTLFLMEGGYAVEDVGVNTVNTLQGFISS